MKAPKIKDLNNILLYILVMGLDILEILDFKKLSQNIGYFSPIFFYGYLCYLSQNVISHGILLIVSIILSIIFIIIQTDLIERYQLNKAKSIKVDDSFIKKLAVPPIHTLFVKIMFVYLFFINLFVSIIYGIYYLMKFDFYVILFIITTVAFSSFFYRLILIIYSRKGIKEVKKAQKKTK